MTNIKALAISVALASALMLPQVARADDDLGVAAIRSHDWATAERVLQEGLQQDPGNVSRQLNLAWVYAQTGRKAEAAVLYREILRRAPDNVASLPTHNTTSMDLLARRGLALLNKQ
jgi:Tfp pilus assembly protein PilF